MHSFRQAGAKASVLAVAAAVGANQGLAGPAAASSLVNGGFELPGGDSVRNQLLSPTDIPGWTYVTAPGGGSYEIYESDNQDGLAAADGSHYVSIGHLGTVGGSLYQDFATIIGDTYTVNYSVAEQQGDDPTQVLRAILTNGAQTITKNNTGLGLSFQSGKSITFTATSALSEITFLDATPVGGGASSNLALDAVSVTLGGVAPGVPEPATWAMMLLGVAGVGYMARRRVAKPRTV